MKYLVKIVLAVFSLAFLEACSKDESDVQANADLQDSSKKGEGTSSIRLSETDTIYVEINDKKSAAYVRAVSEADSFKPCSDHGFLTTTEAIVGMEVDYISAMYTTADGGDGATAFILPRIMVGLEEGADIGIVTNIRPNALRPDHETAVFTVFSCSVATAPEVLAIAAEVVRQDGVRWCEPEKLAGLRFGQQ